MNFPQFFLKVLHLGLYPDSIFLAWRRFVIFGKAMRWRCSWTNAGAASKKPIALSASWSVPTLAVTCCAGGGVFAKHVFFFFFFRQGFLSQLVAWDWGVWSIAFSCFQKQVPVRKRKRATEEPAQEWRLSRVENKKPGTDPWKVGGDIVMQKILQDFEKERFCKILKEDGLHDFLWCWALNCAAWASDTKMQHDIRSCRSWEQTQIQEMGSNLNILQQKH